MLRSWGRRVKAAGRAFVDPPHAPPGHFYSPLAGRGERARLADQLDGLEIPEHLPGIDLRTARQLELLDQVRMSYDTLPWADHASPADGLRYHYDNPAYRYSDAVFYAGVLRHFKPRRVIEVGSGYSSALLLDVDELFLGSKTEITFIEPFPDALGSLLPASEFDGRLVRTGLQAVPLELFDALGRDDILFIDSTHVSRVGSDVNHLMFEVLPRLAPGVLVHVHDVFFPFEYPSEWVRQGWAWNEDYLLRAFLQFNSAFEIVLFNTYLEARDENWFAENMPLCLRDRGGSIWLRRAS